MGASGGGPSRTPSAGDVVGSDDHDGAPGSGCADRMGLLNWFAEVGGDRDGALSRGEPSLVPPPTNRHVPDCSSKNMPPYR